MAATLATLKYGISWRSALLVAILASRNTMASAQDTAAVGASQSLRSMGLPPTYRPYVAVGAGMDFHGEGSQGVGRAAVGVRRDFGNATQGFFGVAAEGYVGTLGDRVDGGGRMLAGIPAIGLMAGIDYSALDQRTAFALSFAEPFRRGGLLVPGSVVRFDFLPVKHTLTVSLVMPLFQPWAGRTRPRATHQPAPAAPPYHRRGAFGADSALPAAVAELRKSAYWVHRLTVPPIPSGDPAVSYAADSALAAHLEQVDDRFPGGHTVAAEVAGYHSALRRAFLLALGAGPEQESGTTLVDTVADLARRVLLNDFLIPFDRELGGRRDRATISALGRRSAAAFAAWVDTSGRIPQERRAAVLGINEALVAIMREAADSAERWWGDDRMVWLPLQFALRPEEHDEQSEIDRLVERISGSEFQPGHDLTYATDERFEKALWRSIREARRYHVLWIHDFVGSRGRTRPDSISQLAVEAYLDALAAAAARFDSTRSVPTYFIFLDQYYFKRSRSKLWLALLQDPLGYRFRLPDRYGEIERAIRARQQTLLAAVQASPALRAVRERRGDHWLRQLFSVRVSVTNPPDPSFRSGGPVPGLPFGLPDDVMRDHRKIAFADLTEADPSSGVANLTGLGVGEWYARYGWLDRTIVLRGPAAVEVKTAAREMLLSQGFRAADIPRMLQPDVKPADYAERVAGLARGGWFARAAIVFNETGYAPKHATAAKAALYSLMPAGSTIIANDPQWVGRYWASMLLGSALRGCKVLIIGPGQDNAPFGDAFVQSSLQRELFLRVVHAGGVLATALGRSGGLIQVGLFRIGLGTHNVPGGVRGVRDGLRKYPFLRQVLPFDQGVWNLFEQADSLLQTVGDAAPQDTAAYYHPKFHLKTQFLGTAAAMREAVGRPEWRAFFSRRILERLHEPPAGTDITLDHLSPLRDYLLHRSTAERERQALYLTVGSQNQDVRSFALDGEATCIVSGEASLISAGDMLLLSTVGVEWLRSEQDVERYLPAVTGVKQRLARVLEGVF